MQKRSELHGCAIDCGLQDGKPRFRYTQIWGNVMNPKLWYILIVRKIYEFFGLCQDFKTLNKNIKENFKILANFGIWIYVNLRKLIT